MAKKKVRGEGQDYDEVKDRLNISLTPTAKRLLKKIAIENGCKSISDYLEKLSRGEFSQSGN